ncbi:putative methyltransferase [Chloroherpeton thalassium ATCC 35110]|uniref:tRNA (guanine-N(7)-)-methyltransferase n=1 Tax=Chloroherpeton thalassium (strain ATCC 35110 / GB-78) TaxID=517418 RepID=TRMB_CHLT3|nr:tRNA (guanosine(46)-N7)-methyltransferase TrmB [Chloroherpeton thalassium]B3QY13.1 RecName: Full=tRNA (guanine-N(7)-)-methyltransferase; AltName: Full=tRNA (guanine(46)-N(7))-methyltransferase; AltName: Full=tRNA(m7G46)-methyltransferase [Chloroherpeton thalassium ATCC 35110]ACF13541.1 putative methyltransferase [Chloroherpeton thalassium ATCC 35110]
MGKGRGRHPSRLKVKPPEPEILAKYLHHWNTKELYHHPDTFLQVSSPSFFQNENPLEIDIGCATGDLVCSLAQKNPQVNFIGVEVSMKPLYRAIKYSVREQIENVRFIKTDFRLLYPLLPDASVQKIFFHFPVPVVRAKDSKYLIFSEDFLSEMHRALQVGGMISVISDSAEYFPIMRELGQNDTRYELISDEAKCMALEPDEKSYYHKYWDAQGREKFRFILVKK